MGGSTLFSYNLLLGKWQCSFRPQEGVDDWNIEETPCKKNAVAWSHSKCVFNNYWLLGLNEGYKKIIYAMACQQLEVLYILIIMDNCTIIIDIYLCIHTWNLHIFQSKWAHCLPQRKTSVQWTALHNTLFLLQWGSSGQSSIHCHSTKCHYC